MEETALQGERTNNRSVRVKTWQAGMNIVPVIETWNGYLIADLETGELKFTNPSGYTRRSSD
jgi:hypothetical protein